MLMRINVELKLLSDTAQIPTYAHEGDSGFDLVANNDGDIVLTKGNRLCVPTGLAVAVPVGYELQVRSRSGLALKNGIAVLNSPGTVDAGYRGEVGVILINHGDDDFVIKNGMKIAQGVIAPIMRAEFIVVSELSDTSRGDGGYGSTGV
jgi:dUTP pyrophosphatase